MLFTIHHASQTGGSIISQALAAATDSILISEINPYGQIQRGNSGYDPTSILWHLTYNSEEINNTQKLKYFSVQLEIAIDHSKRLSKNLFLRDHTHSTFNFLGEEILFSNKRIDSLFIESVNYFYELKELIINFPKANPILSIRHPIDSYLSARRSNCLEAYCGSSVTIDNYCKGLIRLQNKLKTNESAHILRYEDFCTNHSQSIKTLFEEMKIEYNIPTIQEINKIKVTGKSGRQSNNIHTRERRMKDIDNSLIHEINTSSNYEEYCIVNNYNLNYKDTAI